MADFEECTEAQARSGDMLKDIRSDDLPNIPKKSRRKKPKSTSSPKASSKESRSAKPKSKYSNIERQKNVV